MAGARNGSPEQSGRYGSAVRTAAAESPSQSNPSPQDRRTDSSHKWTLAKSYQAAQQRAQLRTSDPELPTITLEIPQPPPRRAGTKITPRLAEEGAFPSDSQDALFVEQNSMVHRDPADIVPTHDFLPHAVNFNTPSPPQYAKTDFSNLKPGSLPGSSLVDPTILDHLGLANLPPATETNPQDHQQPLPPEPQPETSHISGASLFDPALLASIVTPATEEAPSHVENRPNTDIESLPDQPTLRLAASIPPSQRRPIPQPIRHPLPRGEHTPPTSAVKSKKRKNPLESPLVKGLAWALGPVAKPFEQWKVRRAIARLDPKDQAVVEAFMYNYPQPPEEPKEEREPVQENAPQLRSIDIPAWQPPPYPLPGEHHVSEKGQKLETIAYALSDTELLRRQRNHPNEFVGYALTGERTPVSLQVNNNDDLICSAFSEDGYMVQIFMANPLDGEFPHATRMAFGIRPLSQKDTLYSLNATEGEIKRMRRIALQIAELTATSLRSKHHSPKTRQQLNHVFLVALSHGWEEHIPLSEPAQVLLNGNSWPVIETMQYDRSLSTSQHFQAHFHFVTPEDRRDLQLPAVNQQPYATDDLCIDGFARDPQSSRPEKNLFFVLPKLGAPRVVNADFAKLEQAAGLTVLSRWALAFLSALSYRNDSQPPDTDEERNPTMLRINEVILRLQRFLLEYPPGSNREL